jgi:large subunit ribosomal protein L6
MSRIGRVPVPIPPGVTVDLQDHHLRVSGPRGTLARELHRRMILELEGGQLVVRRPTDAREDRALHGLTRTLVANMVQGVTQGYSKGLEIVGVGCRAAKAGDKLVLQVGFSHPVEIAPPEGISFQLETPTRVQVQGINKEQVGQVAATIRAVRPTSVYGNPPKGIQYSGERVRHKVGKAAGKGGK